MTRTIAHRPAAETAPRRAAPLWLRALAWLAAGDADWRDARKLAALPDHRLADMGMRREDAARAFDRPAAPTPQARGARKVALSRR